MAAVDVQHSEGVPLRTPEFTNPPTFSSSSAGEEPNESVVMKLKSFAHNTFTSTKGFVKTSKSWMEFFNVSTVTMPKNVGEAVSGTRKNWDYFRVNYIVCLVLTMLVRSLYSFLLVVFLALCWSWVTWLRPNATGPLKVFGKEYQPMEQRIILGVFSFVMVFFFSNAFSALFTAGLCGVFIVVAHGSLIGAGSSRMFEDDGQDVEAGKGSSNDLLSAGIQMQNMFTSTMSGSKSSAYKCLF